MSLNYYHVVYVILVAGLTARSQAGSVPCMPRVVDDTEILVSLGLSNEDVEQDDEYRVCVRAGPPRILVLFRNGTQIAEFDSSKTYEFLDSHPHFFSVTGNLELKEKGKGGSRFGKAAARLWGEKSLVATVLSRQLSTKEKFQSVLAMGEWPAGVIFSDELEVAGSRVLISRNTFHCSILARLGYIYVGAGYEGKWFYGSSAHQILKDSPQGVEDKAFSFSAALPFVRYNIKLSRCILSDYFWLEDDITAVMEGNVEATTLSYSQYQQDESLSQNFSHFLLFRVGHIGLDFIFDNDLYKIPIFRFKLERMPSIFGSWGACLTKAADVWIPGVWIKLPLIRRELFGLGKYVFPLEIEPLKVHFHYWDIRRYNFGCSLRMNLSYHSNGRSKNGQ